VVLSIYLQNALRSGRMPFSGSVVIAAAGAETITCPQYYLT
jgi:hypothetical protein